VNENKVELSEVERIAFKELADAVRNRAAWWRHRSSEGAEDVRQQRREVAEELEIVADMYTGALES
jgi:hypothetical protein